MACVLAGAAILVYRGRDGIVAMLAQVSPIHVVAAIGLTALAKGGLAQNARLAARRNGILLNFATAARLYNLSQLGKYLPGSIWQFVGRAAAYRRLGASYAAIRDTLLIESLWIVAGAAFVGLVLIGRTAVDLVLDSLTPVLRWWLVGGALVAILCVVMALLVKRPLAGRYLRLAIPSLGVIVAQAGTWLLLGLAFWVLAWACGLQVQVGFAIGLFAAAYAVGFLVPFAPAGLGVRDGILTLGLLPYVPAGEALAVTVLARAIYLVVDVGLVVVQEPMFSIFGGKDRYIDE